MLKKTLNRISLLRYDSQERNNIWWKGETSTSPFVTLTLFVFHIRVYRTL